MTTVATKDAFIKNIAKGKGLFALLDTRDAGTTTAAAAASGRISVQFGVQQLSVIPSAIIGYQHAPVTAEVMAAIVSFSGGGAQPLWFGRWYLLGTVDLTSTGDKFTHDAATFPVTRRVLGENTKPVALIPVVVVTTALTTTAAVIRMRTAAGGTGYVDIDGNNVVGTRTLTFPSATTALSSGFLFGPEDGDGGVQDVVAVEVTTAAAAGACAIYGFEPFMPIQLVSSGYPNVYDSLFGGASMPDLIAALATAGNATSFLGFLMLGSTGNSGSRGGYVFGAKNE